MASTAEARPSLHEIAAMPFSRTAEAVRKHYDPAWGENDEDGEPVKAWRVRFYWTVSGSYDEVVEAATDDEARAIAKEEVRDDIWSGDLGIDMPRVTPAKASGAAE